MRDKDKAHFNTLSYKLKKTNKMLRVPHRLILSILVGICLFCFFLSLGQVFIGIKFIK